MFKLEKCPFCGSEKIVADIEYRAKQLTIYCEECPAEMTFQFDSLGFGDGSVISFSEMHKAMDTLLQKWNNRVKETMKDGYDKGSSILY